MLFKDVADRLWQQGCNIWVPRLRDESASVRATAVRALANLRDPRAIDVLVSALDDAAATVREAVVRSLGPLCAASVSGRFDEQLVRVLSSDPAATVRSAAADILRTSPNPLAAAALVEALADADPAVVQSAHLALVATIEAVRPDQQRHIVEPLTTYLVHDSTFVRATAAALLGRIPDGGGNPGIVTALLGTVRDGEPEVQAAANAALLQLGDPQPEPRLRRLLHAHDGRLALDALERLVARSDPHAGRFLVGVLRHRGNPTEERVRAAHQLARFNANGEEEGFVSTFVVFNLLRQTLEIEAGTRDERISDEVRSAARHALLGILSREPLVVGDLHASMFDDSMTVDEQLAAIGILRELDVRQLENVYQNVPTTRGPVWEAALDGHIDALIAGEGWEAVVPELHHPSLRMRWAALTALEEVGAPAIPALRRVADDEEQDDDLREAARKVLARPPSLARHRASRRSAR